MSVIKEFTGVIINKPSESMDVVNIIGFFWWIYR